MLLHEWPLARICGNTKKSHPFYTPKLAEKFRLNASRLAKAKINNFLKKKALLEMDIFFC